MSEIVSGVRRRREYGETVSAVIMYRLSDGKFLDIRVAYLSFARTGVGGLVEQLGLAH